MLLWANIGAGILRPVLQYMSRNRLPLTNGRLSLKGLQDDVIIRRDDWGNPYITATNRQDMFFTQGVVHAQDRLWQMELQRRTAAGRLAEVLGSAALPLDRLARTLGFCRRTPATWERLPAQQQADCTAYAAGVNSYLASGAPLPLELSLLRHKPRVWEAADSLAIGHMLAWSLNRGWNGKMLQAELNQQLGTALAAELLPGFPTDHPLKLQQGITTSALESARLAMLGKGVAGDISGLGSNAWVIAPSHSATGRPILCNDMHLPVSVPGSWYQINQRYAGGHHVTGASLPGLPYVLIGHNDTIAWGLTLAFADTEDLFLERFNPSNLNQYEVDGEWQEAEIFEEVIDVRGTAAHTQRVLLTRHGPIISGLLEESAPPLALQSTALLPNDSFIGLMALNDAADWEGFRAALQRVAAPSLNVVYADRAGNIGYQLAGAVPVRPHGRGDVPTVGWKNTNNWTGFVPFTDLPHSLNPERGVLISCNNLWPTSTPVVAVEWMNGLRTQRLETLLAAAPHATLSDCQRWQMDVVSVAGVQLVSQLATLETADPAALTSLSILRSWNGEMETESAGAAVYQVLLRQLAEIILRPVLSEAQIERLLGRGPFPILYPVSVSCGYWPATLLRLLGDPTSAWLPGGVGRTAVFVRALRQTTKALEQCLGRDPNQWRWGELHKFGLRHALGNQQVFDLIFSHPPMPIGGDGDTVMQTAVLPEATIAVTYRQVLDVGGWDASSAMHLPGQSGQLASPHYNNLIEPWLNGQYYPLLWNDEAVVQNSRAVLRLTPQ